MKNRLISIFVLTSWLISTILLPIAPPARADESNLAYISPDLDNDGLPNQLELGGWDNAVGHFTTDPLDPDSDDDGLTDGEENLFDSNPINEASPGIYDVYEAALKTKEYYPWQPYGHQFIARGDAVGSGFQPTRPDVVDVQKGLGTNLDALVVRRGSTFYIGGPIEANLQINKSLPTLSDLTSSKNPHTGEWTVTAPVSGTVASGTVGKYTLTLGSRSLDLFVIFELPTIAGELSQTGINKFLYDDNFNAIQDTKSVLMASQSVYNSDGSVSPVAPWWDGQFPPYAIPGGQVLVEGGGYNFENHQYNRYLLEDYVIPAINGKSGSNARLDSANALSDMVDANTAFLNPWARYDTWDVLKAINSSVSKRNQCSGIAGALTAANRAAGLPARVLLTDWHNSTFDHATEVWLGNWRTYRGYRSYEISDVSDVTPRYDGNCSSDHSLWPKCGSNKNYTRASWGQNEYVPYHSGGTGMSSVLFTTGESWTSPNTRAFRWPSWITSTFQSPALGDVTARGTTIAKQGWVETVHSKYWGYWGWTSEPTVSGSSPSTWPPGPVGGLSGSALTMQTGSNGDFQSAAVQLGNVVSEQALDTDGNGKYDRLVLEVKITAAQPGQYWLKGELSATRSAPQLDATGGLISGVYMPVTLAAGAQSVQLVFEGTDIALSRTNGPYLLNGLWITNVADAGPTQFMNNSLAYRGRVHTTSAYNATDFQNFGAMLSHSYQSQIQNRDGDGGADTLLISTQIQVSKPGNYAVEGNLYDGQGNFISHARWSGSGPNVSLPFENIGGTVGPYTLQQVTLRNAQGDSIDQGAVVAYTISANSDLSRPAAASFDVFSNEGGLSTMGTTITPTNIFTPAVVAGDLQITAGVNVAQEGSYKMQAWLADANGNLVTWARNQPTTLSPGTQTLVLTFEGENIRARGVAGPYSVVALKILEGGSSYNVLDKVDVAILSTPAYALNDFTAPSHTLFDNAAEMGAGAWSAGSGWSIQDGRYLYFGQAKAWVAKNTDSSLTLQSALNLSGLDRVGLKFRTSHKFSGNEAGYVEASTNPGTLGWTTVATYTGNASWSDEIKTVDLSAYAGQTLHVRFRLNSAGGAADDAWYINNVSVAGIPDSDDDGLSDEDEENIYGTDPDDADSDNDGMPDGWEVENGFDPLDSADAAGDLDNDGLTNLTEYQKGTLPNDNDTDNDGMLDGWEVTHILNPLLDDANGDPDSDTLTNLQEHQYNSNPKNADSDGDLMPDGWEATNTLNLIVNDANEDADDDDLTNLKEYQHLTNPHDPDSEDDGLPDGWEVFYNFNPNVSTGENGPAGDPDNDQFTNLEEYQHGTNPRDPDTDDDGILDGEDPEPAVVVRRLFLPVVREQK